MISWFLINESKLFKFTVDYCIFCICYNSKSKVYVGDTVEGGIVQDQKSPASRLKVVLEFSSQTGVAPLSFQMLFFFETFIPTLSISCPFFTWVSKWWSVFRDLSVDWLDMSRSDIEDFKSDLHGKSNTKKLKLFAWFLCVFPVFFWEILIQSSIMNHIDITNKIRNVISFKALFSALGRST